MRRGGVRFASTGSPESGAARRGSGGPAPAAYFLTLWILFRAIVVLSPLSPQRVLFSQNGVRLSLPLSAAHSLNSDKSREM